MRAPLEGPRRRRCSWLQQTALRNRRPVRRLLSSAQRDRARREGRRGNVSGEAKPAPHTSQHSRVGSGAAQKGPARTRAHSRAPSLSPPSLSVPPETHGLCLPVRGTSARDSASTKNEKTTLQTTAPCPLSPQSLFACAAPESKITAVWLPACCAQGGGLCQWPFLTNGSV